MLNLPHKPTFLRGYHTGTRALHSPLPTVYLPGHRVLLPRLTTVMCLTLQLSSSCLWLSTSPNTAGREGTRTVTAGVECEDTLPVLRTYPAPHPRGTAWPLPSCCRSSPLRCCRPLQMGDGPVKRHKDRDELPSPAPPSSAGLTWWQEKTGREGRRGRRGPGLCRSVGLGCVHPTLSTTKYRLGDRS